jgi:membrane associated rhomboid family serine protease
VFYVLCGYFAAYAHALTEPGSAIPMIGASGAVSGILGAYLLLYPKARVYTLIFFGFFVQVIRLPALIVIGFWAIIQFVSGLTAKTAAGGGGVAWFAHIGGFVFGLALVKLLVPRRRKLKWL